MDIAHEVVFERDPATAPPPDPLSELAHKMDRAAERIELDDAMRSMELYRLAQRLTDERVSTGQRDGEHRRGEGARFAALKPEEEGARGRWTWHGDTDTELELESVL